MEAWAAWPGLGCPRSPASLWPALGTGRPWEQPALGRASAQPPPAAECGVVSGMAQGQHTCSAPPLRWPIRDTGGSAPKQTLGDVRIGVSARQGGGCSEGMGQDPAPPGLAAGSCLQEQAGEGAVELLGSGWTRLWCCQEPSGAPPQRAKFSCDPPPHQHQDAEQAPAMSPRAGLGSIHGSPIPAINTSRDRP